MKISISSPFPADSLQGNSVSGRRISGLLSDAGHQVEIFQDGFAADCDFLIALNAWRSAGVIEQFATVQGTVSDRTGYNDKVYRVQSRPRLVVIMTGSDLFPLDGILKAETLRSIQLADAIVVTQDQARDKINHPLVREIRKSIELPAEIIDYEGFPKRTTPPFRGMLVAHLREQKNPFLYLRSIPHLKTPIQIHHYGNANSMEFRENAGKYSSEAYEWKGEVPRSDLLKALKNADFLLNTSYIEGSSNAIYESIALGTPIIASAIPGNIGVLGKDYPGLFHLDDSKSLASILDTFSTSESFRNRIQEWCDALKVDFDPRREQKDWCDLLAELTV